MGVKEIIASRNKKKFRFIVLRPRNQSLVRESLDRIDASIRTMSQVEFQQSINDTLQNGAKIVGYLKPNCKLLFDDNGFPTGGSLQPGDVIDAIEDFRRACSTGAYQKDEDQGTML